VKKKGGISCQEETEQVLREKGRERVEELAWEEDPVEEVGWTAIDQV
jgi:hypothetical protein